jgi:hypothetical protein
MTEREKDETAGVVTGAILLIAACAGILWGVDRFATARCSSRWEGVARTEYGALTGCRVETVAGFVPEQNWGR